MKNQKGFSLIELLIVVVIIGIIAAIAIPNLLAARRSANEGSATASMRTLHGAQMTYAATSGNGQFAGTTVAAAVEAGTLAPLQQLYGVNLIDAVLGSGTKSNYVFVGGRGYGVVGAGGSPAQFFFSAIPTSASGLTQTGTRRFGIDTSGVIVTEAGTLTTQFDSAGVGTCQTAPGVCAPIGN